jgi:hypothetical protein
MHEKEILYRIVLIIWFPYLIQPEVEKETGSKEDSLAKVNNSKTMLEIAYDTLSNCDTLSTLTILSKSAPREIPMEVTVATSACDSNSMIEDKETLPTQQDETKLEKGTKKKDEHAKNVDTSTEFSTSIEEKIASIVKQLELGIQGGASLGMQILRKAQLSGNLVFSQVDEAKLKEMEDVLESFDKASPRAPESPAENPSKTTEEVKGFTTTENSKESSKSSSKENLSNVPSLLPELSGEHPSEDSQELILQAAVWIEEEEKRKEEEEPPKTFEDKKSKLTESISENLTNHVISAAEEAIEVQEECSTASRVDRSPPLPPSASQRKQKKPHSIALRAARLAKLRRHKTIQQQNQRPESPLPLLATQAEI